jgi:hypothetical protein
MTQGRPALVGANSPTGLPFCHLLKGIARHLYCCRGRRESVTPMGAVTIRWIEILVHLHQPDVTYSGKPGVPRWDLNLGPPCVMTLRYGGVGVFWPNEYAVDALATVRPGEVQCVRYTGRFGDPRGPGGGRPGFGGDP